jgi:hypothetical protein
VTPNDDEERSRNRERLHDFSPVHPAEAAAATLWVSGEGAT